MAKIRQEAKPLLTLTNPVNFSGDCLPVRKGPRPRTTVWPLHMQCTDHGDPTYLDQLINDILAWPHIDSTTAFASPDTVSVRVEEEAATKDPAIFITDTEFARIILTLPTIYLSLPLVWAHWAIVRGWAEPHYHRCLAKMPPGALLIYTPKNREELAVCYFLFFQAYDCSLRNRSEISGSAHLDG
jgi:hypothetical protein